MAVSCLSSQHKAQRQLPLLGILFLLNYLNFSLIVPIFKQKSETQMNITINDLHEFTGTESVTTILLPEEY
jgi:hypothetical protein